MLQRGAVCAKRTTSESVIQKSRLGVRCNKTWQQRLPSLQLRATIKKVQWLPVGARVLSGRCVHVWIRHRRPDCIVQWLPVGPQTPVLHLRYSPTPVALRSLLLTASTLAVGEWTVALQFRLQLLTPLVTCRPLKAPHHTSVSRVHRAYSNYRPVTIKPPMDSFRRTYIEELVVIHDFEAKEENEVFVSKGQRVRVLNADDSNWRVTVTVDSDEGFIPRTCCTLGPSL